MDCFTPRFYHLFRPPLPSLFKPHTIGLKLRRRSSLFLGSNFFGILDNLPKERIYNEDWDEKVSLIYCCFVDILVVVIKTNRYNCNIKKSFVFSDGI